MFPEKSGYCHPVQVPQAQAEQSKWSLPLTPHEPLSPEGGLPLSALHFQLPSLHGLFPATRDVQVVILSSLLPTLLLRLPSTPCMLALGEHSCPLCHPLQFQPASHPCFRGTTCPASSLPSLGTALLFPAPAALPLCSSSGFRAEPSSSLQICIPSELSPTKAVFAAPAGGTFGIFSPDVSSVLQNRRAKKTPDISTCTLNRPLKSGVSRADLVDLTLRAPLHWSSGWRASLSSQSFKIGTW